MQVCFCTHENAIHALFLENEWAEEVVDGHTNHDGHRMISRENIDGSLAEKLQAYIELIKQPDTDPVRIMQGILNLGFEAGEAGDNNGPMLNDLLHLINRDIEGEIHLSTLLALFEIGKQEGAAYNTRCEKEGRKKRRKKKRRKRASKKSRKKSKKEGKQKAKKTLRKRA